MTSITIGPEMYTVKMASGSRSVAEILSFKGVKFHYEALSLQRFEIKKYFLFAWGSISKNRVFGSGFNSSS